MSIAVTFEMIQEAKKNLEGIVKETDLLFSEDLSAKTGVDLFLKLENLQLAGSFKIRGAYNKMLHLILQ